MGTATPNVHHETNYSLNSFHARGGMIEVGTYTATTLGGYTTIGDVTSFAMKAKPDVVMFLPKLPLTALTTALAGWQFVWDYTNGSVRALNVNGIEATTTFAGSTFVYLNYVAFSW